VPVSAERPEADGEADRRKPPVCSAGLGLGGSNFGAVVGVAAQPP